MGGGQNQDVGVGDEARLGRKKWDYTFFTFSSLALDSLAFFILLRENRSFFLLPFLYYLEKIFVGGGKVTAQFAPP